MYHLFKDSIFPHVKIFKVIFQLKSLRILSMTKTFKKAIP